ncbi:R3H domain-containing protein 1, partial [Halocaridina rubra]
SLSSVDGLGDSPVRSHDSRRNSQDDSRWQESRPWTFMETEAVHRKHHYDNHRLRPGRLPKVESFESRDTLHPRSLRPPVFKSHSFGGYSGGVTVLSRGDSVCSNLSSSRLSKQDSTSSRISDHSSSSGYKTQRQDTSSTNVSNTLSTTPSPTTSQHQHSSSSQSIGIWGGDGDSQAVMWAVTDMEAVPPGAMLINPQSGQPYMNSDGSVYRFDPNNPPQLSPNMTGSSTTGASPREKEAAVDKDASCQPSGGLGGSLVVTQPPPVSPSSPHDLPPPTSTSVRSSPSKQLNLQETSPEPPHSTIVSSSEVKESEGNPGTNEGGPNEGVVTQPPPQVIYPPYYPHPPQLDTRSFSQEGSTNEVTNHMRGLCISGPNSGADSSSDLTTTQVSTAAVPQSFVVPRQHYTQPVYYMPAGSVGNVNGSLKYVYPQYQMAPVQAAPTGVQPATGVQPTGVQQIQGMPTVPAVAGALPAVPVPPSAHHPSIEHNPALPPGGSYVPGGYTVVAYPTGSNVGGNSNGQEQGGTTYYYQIPAAAAAAAGLSGPLPAAQPAQTSLQQYTLTPSTSTTSFPQWHHFNVNIDGSTYWVCKDSAWNSFPP